MATTKNEKDDEKSPSADLNDREPETRAEREASSNEQDNIDAVSGSSSPLYESDELMDPDRPFSAENPPKRALVSKGRDENFQAAADSAEPKSDKK